MDDLMTTITPTLAEWATGWNTVPTRARLQNYFLGGRDNYAADRAVGDDLIAVWPHAGAAAQTARHFTHRAVRQLVQEHGIRQFLDINTGLPEGVLTHEIARRFASDARVVYAESDPLARSHLAFVLKAQPPGTTHILAAALEDPGQLLASTFELLDRAQPIGVVVHDLPAAPGAHYGLRRVVAALPAGSALVLAHPTADHAPGTLAAVARVYEEHGLPTRHLALHQFADLFDGLDLLPPGITGPQRWSPTGTGLLRDADLGQWAAVGLKCPASMPTTPGTVPDSPPA
jgi:hypothetical protein